MKHIESYIQNGTKSDQSQKSGGFLEKSAICHKPGLFKFNNMKVTLDTHLLSLQLAFNEKFPPIYIENRIYKTHTTKWTLTHSRRSFRL